MNKDDLLLSEAYSQVYNEGIWDRLKGQASGIGAGLKQGAQNVASKAASALGAEVKPSGQTMGGSYANAQQTSLVNSFIKKAEKEISDFSNDIKKMGAGANISDIEKTHPQIATQLKQVNGLLTYLKNPQAEPPAAPAAPAAPDAGKVAPTPSSETPSPVAPATEQPKKSDIAQLAASTPSGTGPLTVQNPKTNATSQQATGVVSGIPHGPQRTSTLGGTTNTSFSMANNSQPKQVNQLPKEQPVQKAFTPPVEQDAEIVEPKQASSGTPEAVVDVMKQQDGNQATVAPNDSKVNYKGVEWTKTGTKWNAVVPGKGARTASNADSVEIEKQWQADNAKKAPTSAELTSGGMNPNIRTKNESFRFRGNK
jgi:hypothetical protein